jgi:hypothetical protein
MTIPATDRARKGEPRGFSALGRSYGRDLRGWAVGLAAGYGIAAALLAGGILALFGAVAVGAMALFHFMALRYGTNIAFAVLGGGMLALAATLFLAGWLMMRRRAAPLPKPHRQFRAARQMLVGTTVARAVTALRTSEAAKPDATTQVLLGAAAILAAGWIVATRLGSDRRKVSPGAKVRR